MSNSPSRRNFITSTLSLGAGSLLLGAAPSLHGADSASPGTATRSRPGGRVMPPTLQDLPDAVFVDHDGGKLEKTERRDTRFTTPGAAVTMTAAAAGLEVRVSCAQRPLAHVVLRWSRRFPSDAVFLGDHWERGYGDLQWRFLQPERVLPWYFAAHHAATGETFLAGVKTQPSALCFWTVDATGVSLWLDFRNGGSPSLPGDREILAATINCLHATRDEPPLRALTRLCRTLCPQPRLAAGPICGNNNWYYSYGRDFDANAMRRDAAFLADISSGHKNRPYCVIDAGWTDNTKSVCPGGPWDQGDPSRFPDMAGLAGDMKKLGVRPGIWIRPTALMRVDLEDRLRPGPINSVEKPLDLTRPDNLALIHEDVARVRGWGYDLIKHDFSTFDVFGKWGFEMGADLTDSGWHFADRSLTNAEIILKLYRTLRSAAGDAILLGCNTMGHLGAGLFEIQRTGDDTSGRAWERTRRMGINTLAYRLPQNGTFFASDADCAAHTADTPWELDRQYLDLVARSGTALFVSVDPNKVTPEQKTVFRDAMQLALSGGAKGGCEPLDWMTTTCPREWKMGDEKVAYHWEEPFGINPARI